VLVGQNSGSQKRFQAQESKMAEALMKYTTICNISAFHAYAVNAGPFRYRVKVQRFRVSVFKVKNSLLKFQRYSVRSFQLFDNCTLRFVAPYLHIGNTPVLFGNRDKILAVPFLLEALQNRAQTQVMG
jgi:hypothetical protein